MLVPRKNPSLEALIPTMQTDGHGKTTGVEPRKDSWGLRVLVSHQVPSPPSPTPHSWAIKGRQGPSRKPYPSGKGGLCTMAESPEITPPSSSWKTSCTISAAAGTLADTALLIIAGAQGSAALFAFLRQGCSMSGCCSALGGLKQV